MGLFGSYFDSKNSYGHPTREFKPAIGRIVGTILSFLVTLTSLAAFGCPRYHVWEQGLAGQAELSRAEQNRQIKIQEAKAVEESAEHLANAEIKRATGIAQANKIIGESLHNNEGYLRWLWIDAMKETGAQGHTVYIPTEAGLPILEAGRHIPDTK